MDSNIQLPSTKALISTAASAVATVMLVRSFAQDFVPQELRHYLRNKLYRLLTTFSNEIVLIIDEFEGLNKNHLYSAAELYIGTITSSSTKSLRASLPEKEKKICIAVGGNEELIDRFHGIQLKWRMIVQETKARYVPYADDYMSSTIRSDYRFIKLVFHKKHRSRVINEYLPYVLERSEAVKEGKKTLKLYTLKNDRMHGPRIAPWQSVNLDHPAKFETLAMDDEIKETIIADLDRFVKRKDLYRKVGKAWKRGYLLYGPPGTGKSSLIAAMANYMNYDVYDLELTDLRCNSDLRKLLISTGNRSILVVEDIDASIDLPERRNPKPKPRPGPMGYHYPHIQEPKITLSGLLNFIDGLWSSCGDERIIIFTTNHKEKLDPALLRPGRMDVHIHMSYCTPRGFKMLVNNYLGIKEHPLISTIEEMICSIKVTPAEIGEQLLKSDDPEITLQGLLKFLELKGEDAKREPVVEKVEEEEEEVKLNGLKELIPDDLEEKAMKRDKAGNALNVLLRFLDEETANKRSGSSVEVAKENGSSKTE